MSELWKHKGFRAGITFLGAGVLPFVIITYYVSTASTQVQRNFSGEVNMLWLSLAVGFMFFMLLLPIRLFWRILLGILYLPVAGGALLLWLFIFVCGRFNACL